MKTYEFETVIFLKSKKTIFIHKIHKRKIENISSLAHLNILHFKLFEMLLYACCMLFSNMHC